MNRRNHPPYAPGVVDNLFSRPATPTPPLSPSIIANEWSKLPAAFYKPLQQQQHAALYRAFTPRPSRPQTPLSHSHSPSPSPCPSLYSVSSFSSPASKHGPLTSEIEIEELPDDDSNSSDTNGPSTPDLVQGEFEDAPEPGTYPRSYWSEDSDSDFDNGSDDDDDDNDDVLHSFSHLSTSYGYGNGNGYDYSSSNNDRVKRWMGVPMSRKKRSHAESLGDDGDNDDDDDNSIEELRSDRDGNSVVSSSGGRIRRRRITVSPSGDASRQKGVEEALRRARSRSVDDDDDDDEHNGLGFEMDMEL